MSVTALLRRSRTSAVLSLAAGLAVSGLLTGCANGPSGFASGRLPYKDAAGDGDPFLNKETQTASNGKTPAKSADGVLGPATQSTQQAAYRDGRTQTAMNGNPSGEQNPFAALNPFAAQAMPQNGMQPPAYGQPGGGQMGNGQMGNGQIQQVAYTPNGGYPANGYPANGYPANGYPQAGGSPQSGYPQGAYPPGTFPAGAYPPEQSLPQSGVAPAGYTTAGQSAYPPGTFPQGATVPANAYPQAGGYPQGADPNAMAYAAHGGQPMPMNYATPAGQPYSAGQNHSAGSPYNGAPPQFPAYPPQQFPAQYPPQQFAPQYAPAGGSVQTTGADDGFVMPRSYAQELGFPPPGSQPSQTTTASNDEFLPPIR